MLLDQARDPERDDDRDQDHQTIAANVEKADLGLADRKPRFVERSSEFGKDADVIQDHCPPDGEAHGAFRCDDPALRAKQIVEAVDEQSNHRQGDQQGDGYREKNGGIPALNEGTRKKQKREGGDRKDESVDASRADLRDAGITGPRDGDPDAPVDDPRDGERSQDRADFDPAAGPIEGSLNAFEIERRQHGRQCSELRRGGRERRSLGYK